MANVQARAEVERLAEEQAALRRVATLVARESHPDEIFAKVAEEVALLLGVGTAAIIRYEPGEEMTLVGSWGRSPPVGRRWKLDGESAVVLVYRTQRPVRFDEYEHASGAAAAEARALGVRSAVASPIVVGGRLWGSLAAATSGTEPLPPDAESRLSEFTELVASAISNVQARSDLAASRARVVAASDKTRRQIERDLHDGAQQRLVHIALRLRQASEAVRTDPGAAQALVDGALEHAEQATVELRELVHGILPPVLNEGGLRPAVKALARRMPLPVDVRMSVGRLSPELEATAYFVAAEALTNVAKHSRAGHARVVGRLADSCLRLQIYDDGVGGARRDGSGFVGLADRLAVFGGQLGVDSPAGGGTLVEASIPVG
jgi:signal transduction histidine kinase